FQSQFGRPAAEGKVRLIAQGALRADPRYADVPDILDQGKTPGIGQPRDLLYLTLALGRSLAAPPQTPPDRLAVLREAVRQTMADPDFLAEAKKLDIEIEPMSADDTH